MGINYFEICYKKWFLNLEEKPEAGYSTILATTSTKAALWLWSEDEDMVQQEGKVEVSPMLDSTRGTERADLLTKSQSGEVGQFSAH